MDSGKARGASDSGAQGWPRLLLDSWEGLPQSVGGQKRMTSVLGILSADLPAWLVMDGFCVRATQVPARSGPGGEALCLASGGVGWHLLQQKGGPC